MSSIPAANGDQPQVSVVVLAYDALPQVLSALQALSEQDSSQAAEVIVVWSGDNSTEEQVRSRFPEVRLVGHPQRIPTGAGRNLGIRCARGGTICFLAADCVPARDWLSRRLARHRQGYSAVGGVVVPAPNPTATALAAHLLEYSDFGPHRPALEVRDRPLHNLSYERHLFEQYGYFEEDLVCGEDTLLNARLVAKQVVQFFDPLIQMTHPGPQDLSSLSAHQFRHGAWFAWLARHRADTFDPQRVFRSRLRVAAAYPTVRLLRYLRSLSGVPGTTIGSLRLAVLGVVGLLAFARGAWIGWGLPGHLRPAP